MQARHKFQNPLQLPIPKLGPDSIFRLIVNVIDCRHLWISPYSGTCPLLKDGNAQAKLSKEAFRVADGRVQEQKRTSLDVWCHRCSNIEKYYFSLILNDKLINSTSFVFIMTIWKAHKMKELFKNFQTSYWILTSMKHGENDWCLSVPVSKTSKSFWWPRITNIVTLLIVVRFHQKTCI